MMSPRTRPPCPQQETARKRFAREFSLCAVVLAIGLAITFATLLVVPWKDLAGRWDVYRTIGPQGFYLDWSLHHGVFPQWNPLTLCGMPYAANPVAAAFYPPNLVRSLLTFAPTPEKTQIGWVILMAVHALLAGIGIIALAREHKLSYCASVTAAVVFLFSAIWVRRLCEYHFITMVAWLPWMLWCVRRSLSAELRNVRLWYALACGLAFGAALLSGIANIAPYMGVTLAAYAGLYRATRSGGRIGETVRRSRNDVVALALVFAVAIAVSAAFWLPGAELSSHTSRAKDGDYSLGHPAYGGTPGELVQTLVRYPGLKWEPENIRGAGVGALVLVVLGLLHRRRRDAVLFGGVALILFDCAMGYPYPIATLVERLSPIQLVSSTRAFDFALIPLALLAGCGVDTVADVTRGPGRRALASVTALLVGGTSLWALSGVLEVPKYFPAPSGALVLPSLAILLAAAVPWLPKGTRWAWALPLLVFAETAVWTSRYVPYMIVHRDFAKTAGAYDGNVEFWPDNRRGTDAIPNRHLYALRPAPNGYEPAHIEKVREVVAGESRLKAYHRLITAEEVDQDNARGLLFLKRSFWLARQCVLGPLPPRKTLYPVTTTAFLAAEESPGVPVATASDLPASSLGAGTLVASLTPTTTPVTPGSFVFSPLSLPPRHCALLVNCVAPAGGGFVAVYKDLDSGRTESGHAIVQRERATCELPLPDFVRMQITILPDRGSRGFQVTGASLMADQADEDGQIEVLSREPNRVRVRARDLVDDRLLLFVDAAYPGWKAYVDGVETPIMLANDAFKAVTVSRGTHEVEFVFRSWRVLAGAFFSATVLIGAIAALWRWRGGAGFRREYADCQ